MLSHGVSGNCSQLIEGLLTLALYRSGNVHWYDGLEGSGRDDTIKCAGEFPSCEMVIELSQVIKTGG